MTKRSIIICKSIHHGNTRKVAQAMSKILKASVVEPSEFKSSEIDVYDLIGFGSGIYNGKHHRSLFKLINRLKKQNHKKAFIFFTSTVPVKKFHQDLREALIEKGFDIIGEFCCRGFIDYSFSKYIFGGLNKGRPNKQDLKTAKQFAKQLKD